MAGTCRAFSFRLNVPFPVPLVILPERGCPLPRCWILGFVAGLGSIAGGRTKPSDATLCKKTRCSRILGSPAPSFLDHKFAARGLSRSSDRGIAASTLKTMNTSRTLPQARDTMLERSSPRSALP
jgi:hypothetical protein